MARTSQRKDYIPSGRIGQIIQWLFDNAERIDRLDKVQLTFHCAGRAVIAEIKEREKVVPALS